jgi:hypothetical protein
VLFLLNFTGQFEPEPKCCIPNCSAPGGFRSLFSLIPTSGGVHNYDPPRIRLSGRVSAGKFMFPQDVFDPIADRVLPQESEQSLWMLTPNCNFQF